MTRTVLITGASSGFGRASAEAFLARGWNVVATMRSPANAIDLVAQPQACVTTLDVQNIGSIKRAIEEGIQRFGAIDTLVNNAGFGLFGVFESIPREKIMEQFEVNLFGVMDVTREILPHFRGQGRGTIVNVSSGAGIVGLPLLSLYTASKFALEGFSESLSYELASQNVLVKLVEPGGVVETGFGPRSSTEASMQQVPLAYLDFVAATDTAFAALRARATATSGDVAEVIVAAAEDSSRRLRYVATPDIEPLVRARREMSEEAYMQTMRRRFDPPGPL